MQLRVVLVFVRGYAPQRLKVLTALIKFGVSIGWHAIMVFTSLLWVISASGGALTIEDVVFIDATPAVDHGAVGSGATLATSEAWRDAAANSTRATPLRPELQAPSTAPGIATEPSRHQWPARQPDGTRWGWQPDGATGCHPFCMAKHCGARPDCASCVMCPNRTKELPWVAVADHARRHLHAHAASTRPPRNATRRVVVLRRRWKVSGAGVGSGMGSG